MRLESRLAGRAYIFYFAKWSAVQSKGAGS